MGTPSGTAVNDGPHVCGFGLQAPRVVFPRIHREFLDPGEIWRRCLERTERHLASGQNLASARDQAAVDRNLAGILVRPARIRAEGFGSRAVSCTGTCYPRDG